MKGAGMRLKVEYMDVGDLVPYANNAKLHPDWQVDQIAASIERFGMNDPVGVWTNPDGQLEIVEGHGRVLALKKLGIEKCPVIKLDHLDDDARRAYTHVHNQTNLTSGFDWALLGTELAELPGFDWDEFGFVPFDDALSSSIGGGEDDEFEAPAEFKEYDEDIETQNKCPRCGYEW